MFENLHAAAVPPEFLVIVVGFGGSVVTEGETCGVYCNKKCYKLYNLQCVISNSLLLVFKVTDKEKEIDYHRWRCHLLRIFWCATYSF